MFPFVRRIVGDLTRDGGFPSLNLETIDFLALYRAELAGARRRRPRRPGRPEPRARVRKRTQSALVAELGHEGGVRLGFGLGQPRRQRARARRRHPGGVGRRRAGRRRRSASRRAGARRSARDRPRPAARSRAAPRASRGRSCRRRSGGRARRGCCCAPGKRRSRELERVEGARPGERRRPAQPSSALRKLMSKPALWITSRASPTKARNSSATSAKTGLSARNAAVRPCTATASGRHLALGVDVGVEGPAGRHVVDELDRADLDDPVAGAGSSPVVSVSSTISRMRAAPP